MPLCFTSLDASLSPTFDSFLRSPAISFPPKRAHDLRFPGLPHPAVRRVLPRLRSPRHCLKRPSGVTWLHGHSLRSLDDPHIIQLYPRPTSSLLPRPDFAHPQPQPNRISLFLFLFLPQSAPFTTPAPVQIDSIAVAHPSRIRLVDSADPSFGRRFVCPGRIRNPRFAPPESVKGRSS
jgi:hypothetical protein